MSFFKRLLLKRYTNEKTNDHRLDSAAIFSISSAKLTLESKINLKGTGKAAIGLKGVSGMFFAEALKEVEHLFDVDKKDSDLSYRLINDSYGYIWIILQSRSTEHLLSSISAVGQILSDRGFARQLFTALFQFIDSDNKKNNRYLVYNYASNKFYPFVPIGKNARDNETEREIMDTVVNEMPLEKDTSLWYPIWDLNL